MKHLLFLLFMLVVTIGNAQVKVDKAGNYYAAKSNVNTDTITGKTFTDAKGATYPVFKSARNAVYIWRTAKKGNKYKQYLTVK